MTSNPGQEHCDRPQPTQRRTLLSAKVRDAFLLRGAEKGPRAADNEHGVGSLSPDVGGGARRDSGARLCRQKEEQRRAEMAARSRPELFDFHGVAMVKYFTDNWENVQNFKARPDDILIATYPKAGTTWVSQIVDLLYFGKSIPERKDSIPIYQRVPFLEACFPDIPSGSELASTMTTSPRLIKTHFPVQFVPKSFWEQNSRVIYVARNAKDNAVSYFHFDRMNFVEPEPGDWPSFLQRFKEGDMVFGSWYDHVKNWWEKKQSSSNILYMFYEDLVEDTAREINRICSFLGISPSKEEQEYVRGQVDFNTMKNNRMANYSTIELMDFKISPFMRKGKVGDWKNHFTVAQNEEFDVDYQKKMANGTLHFKTDI